MRALARMDGTILGSDIGQLLELMTFGGLVAGLFSTLFILGPGLVLAGILSANQARKRSSESNWPRE
jgi:hypothetical protein